MAIFAFDCDGTLRTYKDRPRRDVIDLLISLHRLGNRIIVWSGGGKDWAAQTVKMLFLEEFVDEVMAKPSKLEPLNYNVDVCFDDEFVDLAIINVKV